MEITETLSNGNTIVYNQLDNGTCYHKETPQAIIDVLERSRLSQRGLRIRIFLGDTKTGKCWNDEYDVVGYVGRSTGNHKIPLLIYNKKSIGGGAILDHCIIKIIDNRCNVLYQHENFHTGEFRIMRSTMSEYCEDVLLFEFAENIEWTIQASFKKAGQAQGYVDFMTGKRFTK